MVCRGLCYRPSSVLVKLPIRCLYHGGAEMNIKGCFNSCRYSIKEKTVLVLRVI